MRTFLIIQLMLIISLQESGFFKEFTELAFGDRRKIGNFNWARKISI